MVYRVNRAYEAYIVIDVMRGRSGPTYLRLLQLKILREHFCDAFTR